MNKTAVLLLCLLFVSIVMISSCSKPLDQPGFPGFRCSYGNKEYIADTAYYVRSIGTTIYAKTGDSTKFKLYLETADTTGNFTLDSIRNTAYYFDGNLTLRSIEGNVNVSQYYNDSLAMMSGSFSFFAREQGSSGRTLNITYGYFNNIPRH